MKLNPAGLKARLKRTPPAFSVYGDDGTGREEAALTSAAVLVPIVRREPEMTVIFTQRTAHLRAHSGQVSFPGGRAEPHDPTPEFTALREAHEEIGLPMERVEVLARLPDYLTRTGFRVTRALQCWTCDLAGPATNTFTGDGQERAVALRGTITNDTIAVDTHSPNV